MNIGLNRLIGRWRNDDDGCGCDDGDDGGAAIGVGCGGVGGGVRNGGGIGSTDGEMKKLQFKGNW